MPDAAIWAIERCIEGILAIEHVTDARATLRSQRTAEAEPQRSAVRIGHRGQKGREADPCGCSVTSSESDHRGRSRRLDPLLSNLCHKLNAGSGNLGIA